MDAVTIMTAVNNLNMVNTLNMLAVQDENSFIVTENGKECEIMSGSILDAYIGKDCAVSLFNDMGGIKGKLMDVDAHADCLHHPPDDSVPSVAERCIDLRCR